MAKPKEEKPESEDVIMERMNDALKRAMNTPHQTQKEMIERRRKGDIERRRETVPAEQRIKRKR